MKIIEKLAALATPNSPAAAALLVETLQERINQAEQVLADASQAHRETQLALALEPDPKALQGSAQRVEQAAAHLEQLRQALATAHLKSAAVDAAITSGQIAVEWSHVDDLLSERRKAVMAMKDAADQLCAQIVKAIDLTEAAWEAIPLAQRPPYRPRATSSSEILSRLTLHLFGFSNGLISRAGVSPHTAKESALLIESIDESDRMFKQSKETA
jgi:hypothetical protein